MGPRVVTHPHDVASPRQPAHVTTCGSTLRFVGAGEILFQVPGSSIVRRLRAVFVPPFDRAAYRVGLRVMATPAIAIAAWGLVTGVALVESGLTIPFAILMTVTVFAGSAQLAVLPLLAAGSPLPVVWITALLVNLRFVIFSAASRSYFARLPWQQRLLAAYVNGDVGFALFMQRYGHSSQRGTAEQLGFFYATAAMNWVAWIASSIAGIYLGGVAPTSWGLKIAAVLALIAVVIPMVKRLPALAGVVVTGSLSLVTVDVPLKLGLLISMVSGVVVAIAAEAVLPARAGPVEIEDEALEIAVDEGA